MAKKNMFVFREKRHKKRKGIHSKNKSRTKGGPQYVKPYIGQGR
mgnify:CR=1 FL=1|tara:strand:+ start:592 stop:723 length:132 start_codon:yes stop_codon:yes gene_type:complete